MRVMTMGFEEAANTVGEAIANLPQTDLVENREYPAPDIYQDVTMNAGFVTCLVRWSGISQDDGGPFKIPRGYRFELRLLADKYGTTDSDLNPDGLSAYVLAQRNILRATASLYENLTEDRSLGGLVVGTTIVSSFTGDLIDPEANAEYFGHEAIFETQNLI